MERSRLARGAVCAGEGQSASRVNAATSASVGGGKPAEQFGSDLIYLVLGGQDGV